MAFSDDKSTKSTLIRRTFDVIDRGVSLCYMYYRQGSQFVMQDRLWAAHGID